MVVLVIMAMENLFVCVEVVGLEELVRRVSTGQRWCLTALHSTLAREGPDANVTFYKKNSQPPWDLEKKERKSKQMNRNQSLLFAIKYFSTPKSCELKDIQVNMRWFFSKSSGESNIFRTPSPFSLRPPVTSVMWMVPEFVCGYSIMSHQWNMISKEHSISF